MGLVHIYRFGVLEFTGILTRIERTLSDAPTVRLKGVDVSWLLNTRAIDSAIYLEQTAQAILSSLLTNYSCGIAAGNLGSSSTDLSVVFDTTQLLAAIQQVIGGAGYQYRVNPNLTLDYSNVFGVQSSAVFTEAAVAGVNLIASSSTLVEDMSLLQNSMHVRGGTGTSVVRTLVQEAASILAVGLLEGSDLEPAVTDPTTLAAIGQYDATKNSAAGLIITLNLIDAYPSLTYNPYDSVTVNSPTLGLSGFYQVKQITRTTLTNPYVTQLQLGARAPEAWQLDEPVKQVLNQIASS
jgi:hypothetical protein